VFEPFTHIEGWISLLTLSAMEIVLGIDNIVFLSLMVEKVPRHQQRFTRTTGLILALGMRLLLLLSISWVMSLKEPLFTVFGKTISGRDLILIVGGAFLIGKATHEIYEKLEIADEEDKAAREAAKNKRSPLVLVLAQIMILDIVFSLDSVITAVGMAQHIPIMMAAMVVAAIVMIVFAGRVGRFVTQHPSMTILALSFLILIGVMLVADGLGQHVSKGYVYTAMAFSLFVEIVNMRLRRRKRAPVKLHTPTLVDPSPKPE
jgi:predicted tellurium resistance membrane protein TerC